MPDMSNLLKQVGIDAPTRFSVFFVPAANSFVAMIPWVPCVALVDVLRFSFLERAPWGEVWANLGRVAGVSLVLYAVVVYRVRRSDR